MQNKELILDDKLIKVDGKQLKGGYKKEDFKNFNPNEHSFYKDKLIESFIFNKKNYFKGIACKCCVTKEDYEWQFKELLGDIKSEENKNLSWANIFINFNYEKFINLMYPLFSEYETVFVCNEKANLTPMPFVVKDFRVGYNAMINDYPQIEDMKRWIDENNIEGYLFLFAASSFSELAIHQLYEHNDKNTYLDIGTGLNMFMDMRNDRGYLDEYWHGNGNSYLNRKCVW